MNGPRFREKAFVSALVLGVLADQLVRANGRPGLNVLLWALAGVAILAGIARNRETPVSQETRVLVGGAVAFAALLVTRDADALAAFCLLSAVLLLGLAAGRAALGWAARTNFVHLAAAGLREGTLIALGPFGWSIGGARQALLPAPAGGRSWPRYAKMGARGAVMAALPLLVLTGLLTSADPVFERLLHNALFTGLEPALEHIAFAGVIAWFVTGYLRAFLVGDEAVMDRVRLPRPALAPAEISVAVTLLNVLFIVFLVVQVRYLFGGASIVALTDGLTYAEYARRGFFEMVAATAFVVPVLLVADWAAAENQVMSRRVLRATSTTLVLLLFGTLGSAAYRMKLYTDAYGLTEDRLYGSMFMVWLTSVLGWLAITVLRGRRSNFALGAIVSGLTCIVALHAVNPHALIAKVNISRAASGAEVDARYLKTLSADAVPALIARLPALPQAERCQVAGMLKERWSGERRGGWRTWNISDARARRMVREVSMPADCPVVAAPVEGAPK